MGVMTVSRSIVATAACTILSSCASGTGGEGHCESRYDGSMTAPTWVSLMDAMVESREWGRVASTRIQAKGVDVGAGDQDAVRVVDLLDHQGRRLVQVDVWRTDAGSWSAGVWSQCIG
ncbi:hypothetical protein [Nocardioides dubius]